LNQELIHTDESIRVFVLEYLPLAQVGGGAISGKAALVRSKHIGGQVGEYCILNVSFFVSGQPVKLPRMPGIMPVN